jgi:hypothetical protein
MFFSPGYSAPWPTIWLSFAPSLTGERFCVNHRSINDAMASILMGKLNALNSWRNFSSGKLGDCVEAGEGVSNQLRGVADLMHLI